MWLNNFTYKIRNLGQNAKYQFNSVALLKNTSITNISLSKGSLQIHRCLKRHQYIFFPVTNVKDCCGIYPTLGLLIFDFLSDLTTRPGIWPEELKLKPVPDQASGDPRILCISKTLIAWSWSSRIIICSVGWLSWWSSYKKKPKKLSSPPNECPKKNQLATHPRSYWTQAVFLFAVIYWVSGLPSSAFLAGYSWKAKK